MESHQYIWEFLWAVVNNWAGYATGGIVTAVVWFWLGWREKAMTRKFLKWLSICFFVMACYKAWEDQYEKAAEAGRASDANLHQTKEYQHRIDGLSDKR